MNTKILAASAALCLLACEGAPTATGDSAVGTTDAASFVDPVAHYVTTTDATLDLSSAGATPMKYTANVQLHASGAVTGRFRGAREDAAGTIIFAGPATCLAVDPLTRRAWIGGVIDENRSTNPTFRDGPLFQVGKAIWFRVVDYSERGTPVDRSTTFGFEGSAGIITSAEYCATMPWPMTPVPDARTFPLASGQFKVR